MQDALSRSCRRSTSRSPSWTSDNIVFAQPGFSIIATANTRDRGVNDLSSALKRRFNFVRIPVVTNKRSEAEIVRFRTTELLRRHRIELELPPTLLDILLQSFADLRAAAAAATSRRREARVGAVDGRADRRAGGRHPAQPVLRRPYAARQTLAGSLVGSLARRSPEDLAILNKFWHGVVEPRSKKDEGGPWTDFLEGGRQAIATLS